MSMRVLSVYAYAAAVASLALLPLDAQIDLSAARQYFTEVQALVRTDGGRLWGMSLDGPLLIVDPKTRAVVASAADREGLLTRRGNVYAGTLPGHIPLSNTIVDWGGVTWAMIMTPVASEAYARNALFIHELWHRIQADIGFPGTNPANEHLTTREGRIYMQLELRALQNALNYTGNQRRDAVRDALLFRTYRHSLFPHAAEQERLLENHEGLAEYTGIVIAIRSADDQRRFTIQKLRIAERMQSYTRAFAYHTTPAYGILLDAVSGGWQRSFTRTDHLPDLVAARYGIFLPPDPADEARRRAREYDGGTIVEIETERHVDTQKEIADYRQRFIAGPRLVIPLSDRRISFDPRGVIPLNDYGRVYTTLTVTDEWGKLEAKDGALLSEDWQYVFVDVPPNLRGRRIEGRGYVLLLNEGWRIEAGDRHGDYIVRRAR
jgi:hypothetical protein